MRFRLLDRVDALEARRAVGRKAVSFEEYTLARPGFTAGALPGALLLEAIAQLGTWLVLEATGFASAPLVTSIDRAALPSPLRAAEVATVEVSVRAFHDDAARFDGRARVGERDLAVVEGVTCVLVAADRLFDVAEARAELEALRGRYPGPR